MLLNFGLVLYIKDKLSQTVETFYCLYVKGKVLMASEFAICVCKMTELTFNLH